MKHTYYFPHDYHARHDPKLEKLFSEMGYEGVGIYWGLIERLYEQSGYMKIEDLDVYSNGDVSLCERIARVVMDFKLFKVRKGKFWSESCLRRLKSMTEKRDKASQSALKRWNKDADAMPTQCEGNAIKESKVKESKEEEIRGALFMKFWNSYPKQIGMSMAQLTFRATIKTDQDFDDLMAALKNYMQSKEYKGGFIKNGDRWIEDWRGWIPKKRVAPVVSPAPVSEPAPFTQPSAEDRAKLDAITKKIGKTCLVMMIMAFCAAGARAEITEASYYTRESCLKESGQAVMANGKELNDENLTCASWDYPFGARLKISRLDKEGKALRSVIAVVADRGPSKRLYRMGRRLDLSKRAFSQLAPIEQGIITVRIEKL